MKFADLHIHSYFSDGCFSVQDILKMAKEQSLSCIAFTDHDSVGAYLESDGFKDILGLEIIPAVEVTTEYNSKEVHILGYFIDYKDPHFLEKLKYLRKARILRIKEMIKKLNSLNIDVSFEELNYLKEDTSITRLHLAELLLKKGFVQSILEAFIKYLGENASCYVAGFHFSPFEAIKLIQDAKGIPVLAHPYNVENLELLLLDLINYGLKGIEVYYPQHSPQQVGFYEQLAQKYGLLLTGGSDFHGNQYSPIKIGSVRIPYDLVEKLKEGL